jgi:hypothetical protein
MANIGRTISVILTSVTAIVSADYIKPFVAVMLPPEWLPPPPAVVWQQPRPQPQSDQTIQPTLAEKSPPLQLVSPRPQTEPTPKATPSPKPHKRTRSNKQSKNHKPTPAPIPTAPPVHPEPESVNPRRETQYPVHPEPQAIRRDGLEQPLPKTAPECWDDLLDESCQPPRRTPPAWESDPPPPDWPGWFELRPDVPPPGWRPPPRARRDWRGSGRRFDPERFGRWERRRWRYR